MSITILIIIVSIWLTYEFLRYDIQHYYRKYNIDKIINNTCKIGVKLCQRLIETKSEN